MRRVVLTVAATIAGLVLLLGFKSHGGRGDVSALGVASAPPTASDPSPASTAPTTPGSTARSSAPTTAAPPSPTPARTVTGQAVDTRYGPVQVAIRVSGGRITDVGVTQVPVDTGRDRAINDDAVPRLDQEALSAQSAHIDSISGASYTSQGYVDSLQSAIDAAGLR